MKTIKGIDVSEHQGFITWGLVKNQIDFAMLRAGYGKGHVDKQFKRNADECSKYGIPFGVYWFSYALSSDDAKSEAEYCMNLLKGYSVTYIAYDWEYDSDTHASKYGVLITNAIRQAYANAFLNTVKTKGYTPMLYTNVDYINKGFNVFLNTDIALWLAAWGVKAPTYDCKLWQYSNKGIINGITGNVDMNVGYAEEEKGETTDWLSDENVHNRILVYDKVADDIINGLYGVNPARVQRVKEAGYDPILAQKVVNYKKRNER